MIKTYTKEGHITPIMYSKEYIIDQYGRKHTFKEDVIYIEGDLKDSLISSLKRKGFCRSELSKNKFYNSKLL